MEPHVIFFIATVILYLPLAGILLYVWSKYGKGERFVVNARAIFLVGSLVIFLYMLTL